MSAAEFAAVPTDFEPGNLEEPLSEGVPQAGRPWRRRAALAALGLGVLGLVAAGAWRPALAAPAAATAPAPASWAGVEEVIQASAVEELGRTPTSDELDAFKKHVARSSVLQAPLRQLGELSEDCQKEFVKLVVASLKKLGKAIFKAIMACAKDKESDACKSAEEDLKSLDDKLKEDCETSDTTDMCNGTLTTKEGTEHEPVCLPKVCEDDIPHMEEKVEEKECAKFKDDDECEVKLICP